MTQKTRNILIALLLAVCMFSSFMFLRHQLDKSRASKIYKEALEMATSQIVPNTEPVEAPNEPEEIPETTAPPELIWVPAPLEEEDPHIQELESINLTVLQEKNSDVLGWILLPGSGINYPVLQGEDNQYYLERTWVHFPNYTGSIFLDAENNPDFTDFNSILYGHNMSDGSMFAPLHRYSSQSHWEQYPYAYLLTADGIFRYEIFSAYKASVDSETYGLSFRQTETRVSFLENAAENSVLDTGIEPAITDRILTLSTCSSGSTVRWVVHARLPMIQVEP